jgi:putative ribosome biogenesis GTPase RsgA
MIEKIEQVSEILKVRYSVIMIGQTMTGKSTILKLALQHGIQ